MVGFSTPQRTKDRYQNPPSGSSLQCKSNWQSPALVEKKRNNFLIRSPGMEAAYSDFASPSSFCGQQIPKSSHVRVVARIRPLNSTETKNKSKICVMPIPPVRSSPAPSPLRGYSPSRSFTFNEASPKASPSRNNNRRSPLMRSPLNTPPRLRTPIRRNTTPKMPPSQETPKSRFRSCSDDTSKQGDKDCISRGEAYCSSLKITAAKDKQIDLDAVFGPNSSQKDVYERSVGDAVRRNVFRGFNTTILTFGQTGSGKTYTMSGPTTPSSSTSVKETPRKSISDITSNILKSSDSESDRLPALQEGDGILSRAVYDLFRGRSLHSGCVTIKLTYIEIYNDDIRDLLADPAEESELELRDYGAGGIDIKNLKKIEVKKPEHVQDLIKIASQRRASGLTRANDSSSRSHAICTLHVTIAPPRVNSVVSSRAGVKTLISSDTIYAKLTLVDLAGSERIKVAKTEGVQQKESISINTDLLVLGKVVMALAEKQKRNSRRQSNVHIPYRDSVLTRLLRDSLGGNCCTVMVACISPAASSLEESMNTLRYAMRTRSITNSVVRNIIKKKMTPTEVMALKRENKKLRMQLVSSVERLKKLENAAPCSFEEKEKSENSEHDLKKKVENLKDELEQAKKTDSTTNVESRLKFLLKALKDVGVNINMEDTLRLSEEGLKDLILTQQQSSLTLVDDDRNCIMFSPNKVDNDKPSDDSHLSDDSFFFDFETENFTLDETATTKKMICEQLEDEEFALQERVAGLAIEFDELNAQLETKKTKETRNESFQGHDTTKIEANKIEMITKVEHDEITSVIIKQLEEEKTLNEELKSKLKKAMEDKKKNEETIEDLKSKTNHVDSKESLQKQIGILTKERNLLAQDVEQYQDIMAVIDQLNEEKDSNTKLEEKNKKLESEIERCDKENKKLLQEKSDLLKKKEQMQQMEAEERDVGDTLSRTSNFSRTSLTEKTFESDLTGNDDDMASFDSASIREHAAKVLNRANSAMIRSKSKSLAQSKNRCPIPSRATSVQHPDILKHSSNKNSFSNTECTCIASNFSGNSDHVEFFLPKLGKACKCKKRIVSDDMDAPGSEEDPTALPNILRPWQVEFLSSIGIKTASQLIKARRTDSTRMAKSLIHWRKKKMMKPVKLKSCFVALHIWARTSKVILKSHKQYLRNKKILCNMPPPQPNIMEISFGTDHSVSTLGDSHYGEMMEI